MNVLRPWRNLWIALWWLLWLVVVAQQLLLHKWSGSWSEPNPQFSRVTFAVLWSGSVIGAALRVFVFPKIRQDSVLFVVVLAGLIPAAMSALTFSFLSVPFAHISFIAAMLVVAAYAPVRSPKE